MVRTKKHIIILIIGLVFFEAAAQNSQVLYYMNLPQNHLLNPALRPSNNLYIGIPVVSGVA